MAPSYTHTYKSTCLKRSLFFSQQARQIRPSDFNKRSATQKRVQGTLSVGSARSVLTANGSDPYTISVSRHSLIVLVPPLDFAHALPFPLSFWTAPYRQQTSVVEGTFESIIIVIIPALHSTIMALHVRV